MKGQPEGRRSAVFTHIDDRRLHVGNDRRMIRNNDRAGEIDGGILRADQIAHTGDTVTVRRATSRRCWELLIQSCGVITESLFNGLWIGVILAGILVKLEPSAYGFIAGTDLCPTAKFLLSGISWACLQQDPLPFDLGRLIR